MPPGSALGPPDQRGSSPTVNKTKLGGEKKERTEGFGTDSRRHAAKKRFPYHGEGQTMRKACSGSKIAVVLVCSLALVFLSIGTAKAWEPTKPVEFIIPAGAGGGADVMARFISPIIEKYKLSPKPFIVINKSGGAGAEGFLYVKGKKGDPHVIAITLDNLFTTPLATGVPFAWRDLTPVSRLALDWFILVGNAETAEKPAKLKMGGTGSAQEDQIITIQLEQAFGGKFIYVPFKGGGEVCTNLVGKHVNSTVNNPSECVGHWKAKRGRPPALAD